MKQLSRTLGARFLARGVRILLASALVGVAVAVGAAGLMAACQAVTRLALNEVVGYHPSTPAGEEPLVPGVAGIPLRPWLLVPVAAVGGLLAGLVTQRFAPEAAGPGTDAVIRAYDDPNGGVRGRVALVKIVATALTIGTGGSGGREGPIVQIGAAIGSTLARWFRFTAAEQRLLLAAGMAAGVSAVFRTPLAGALFAAEVLYRSEELEREVFLPACCSATTAYAVAVFVFGWGPLLPAPPVGFTQPPHYLAYALLAILLVLLARAYIAAFYRAKEWFKGLPIPAVLKPALGAGVAALVGVALFYATSRDERSLAVLGFGLGTLQETLTRPEGFTIGLLVAIALGKLVTTRLTVGSGCSGGVFGPALVIGGCAGGALGLALQPLGREWVAPPTAFALLGMAGLFSAAAKTPLSTLVIVCELTGDFGLIPPALAVCAGCFALSGWSTLFESQPLRRSDSPVHQFPAPSDGPATHDPASEVPRFASQQRP